MKCSQINPMSAIAEVCRAEMLHQTEEPEEDLRSANAWQKLSKPATNRLHIGMMRRNV